MASAPAEYVFSAVADGTGNGDWRRNRKQQAGESLKPSTKYIPKKGRRSKMNTRQNNCDTHLLNPRNERRSIEQHGGSVSRLEKECTYALLELYKEDECRANDMEVAMVLSNMSCNRKYDSRLNTME
ncbi:uncharacterized protein LOC127264510 [Andrographis paniculata]|uniref:uncharacterized protein LOC127264510 n=1 Tax=Andrographis paniculata TaxID=175694 RepID=UPI0021E9AC4B|nr:uncharacterized protein LOC127264510 [Andrographis paniculata]